MQISLFLKRTLQSKDVSKIDNFPEERIPLASPRRDRESCPPPPPRLMPATKAVTLKMKPQRPCFKITTRTEDSRIELHLFKCVSTWAHAVEHAHTELDRKSG